MKQPGDRLASAMEYMPGNGVYEEDGELFAGICGELEEDNQKMIVCIKPSVSIPVEINEGDTVFGRIQSLRDSMVSVEILKVKGEKRSIGNYTVGTLHIAKMSSEYVSDIKKLYQINDLIQATVIKAKPAIELTTSPDKDGVVFARCGITHDVLKLVDGELWSEELRRRTTRKISNVYGKVQV
ncbi:MAG: exosome complex RNA-binding protein Csl4 [Candidatus Thermoplasmatota archaeon]|jgi:exosome complex component CSL4|nr:exosome complex RNA-binding protein Csl4 [Candidatus Thermoplasmatota archaeon]MEC8997163.1 exosome complex RNA-binding protein Csl4 [Candidatus Thermoplasmatota archaeon]MED6306230.1 exosome complex RNA-binding protein Csl4 [Candidatus Thermoplasmatota archaeon]